VRSNGEGESPLLRTKGFILLER